MRKKGFTLIELLAVIIILAVIALIATPIVLNVVDNAKESARQSSVAGYADATKLAVYDHMFAYKGQIPTIDQAFIDTIKPQGDTVTCENVLFSNTYGVVLNQCHVGNVEEKKYCFASGKTYSDCTNQEYQDIYNNVNSNVDLLGKQIGQYAKALVYDGDNCKTDGTTYQYMNGCYLKGEQSTNYVWYSGFLWRIMGINEDGTVRMITEENVTGIPYNAHTSTATADFQESYVDKWLNEYFLDHLKNSDIINMSEFCQGKSDSTMNLKRANCDEGIPFERKVGLISIDEYNLANGALSYLKNNQLFTTLSVYNIKSPWSVNQIGNTSGSYGNIIYGFGIRPVVNVNFSSIVTTGDGSTVSHNSQNGHFPYVLNQKIDEIKNQHLESVAGSGEYVKFGGNIYRIVSTSNEGVKLILDGYYQEAVESNFKMSYGESNVFSVTSGIGKKLNTDVLNFLAPTEQLKDKILLSTWYQNNTGEGDIYTKSLEEINPTRIIENVKVGLIRMGEMLSANSSTILANGKTDISNYDNALDYWMMTPNIYSSTPYAAWVSKSYGGAYCGFAGYGDIHYEYALRPVIVVKPDLMIAGGNGMPNNPYEI